MAQELAGTLVERVGVETWIDVRDDAGAVAGYWQAQGVAHAAVEPDAVGAAVGETRRPRQRWRVTLRAPQPVTLTSRLRWRSGILAVLAVESDPRQPDRLVLRCEVRDG